MANYKRNNGKMQDQGFRMVFDAKDIRGTNGAEMYTRAPQFFDHFLLPQTMATNWVDTKVNTGTFAILNAGMGGVAEIATSGASGDSNQEVLIQSGSTGSGFNPSKNALERPLSFETRLILPSVAAVEVFFGFIDGTGRANAINYAISATSTASTSVSNDAAVFAYSSVPTSGALFPVSGNNLVGAVTSIGGVDTISATTIAADTNYHVYRIEVDVNGAAYFLIDDKLVKFVNAALTANTNLFPSFQCTTRTAGIKKLDIDYVLVGAGLAATTT